MYKPLPLQSVSLLTYESRYRFYGPVHLSYRLNPWTQPAGRGKAARVVSKPVNVGKLFFTPAFSVHFSPEVGLHDYCSLWCCIIEKATDCIRHQAPAKRVTCANVSLISGPSHLNPYMILTLQSMIYSQRFKWHLLVSALKGAVQTRASDNALSKHQTNAGDNQDSYLHLL